MWGKLELFVDNSSLSYPQKAKPSTTFLLEKWCWVLNFAANQAALTLALLGKIGMFLGEYQYKIDDKKRVAVPTNFRKKLGQNAVITRGLDNCLFLYPKDAWEKLAKKISELPLAQADARRFARIMLAGAMEVSIDKAGRILLPDYLKDYAKLNKNVTVAGVYDRVEIWDEKIWKNYKHKIEAEAGQIAERLKELGI